MVLHSLRYFGNSMLNNVHDLQYFARCKGTRDLHNSIENRKISFVLTKEFLVRAIYTGMSYIIEKIFAPIFF